MDKGARLLSSITNLEMLSSQMRAYYEFASGVIAATHNRFQDAEAHLRLALSHKLRTDNDRALVEIALADALVKQGNREEVPQLLSQARKRCCKPAVLDQIEKIKESLDNEE